MENDEDDDVPALSQDAIQALQEFLSTVNGCRIENSVPGDSNSVLKVNDLSENWQLSQFWYSDDTASALADEICNEIPEAARIALIGCPSLYYFVKNKIDDKSKVILLDIDTRFSVYKEDFLLYDYNNQLPPDVPKSWKNTFDVVVLDPPFLSEECMTKCALTAKFFMKNKVMICTGLVMENLVYRLFHAKKTCFKPKHKNNLGNEFSCFINYTSKSLTFETYDSIN